MFVAALALPATLFATGAPVGATSPPSPPPGLRPTQVNVTSSDALQHRWGEPEVAVNPKDPNNLVYNVMRDELTYACEKAQDPNCTPSVPAAPPGFSLPRGFFEDADWASNAVWASFDRGQTWKPVRIPRTVLGHEDQLLASSFGGDPMVSAGPDGTFYIAWEPNHLVFPGFPFPAPGDYGCVVVSKSTDGGLHWTNPECAGTPVDRPYMVTDQQTGTVYEASSGTLGQMSTGDPLAPNAPYTDRYVVASQNAVTWTTPHRLGGGGTPGFSASGGVNSTTAAFGVLAAAFTSTSAPACAFFVQAAAPCTVFQTIAPSDLTSTDPNADVSWSRHLVPNVPSNTTDGTMVAADPAEPGHFTVAVLNSTGSQFLVYRTTDSGNTWSGPTAVGNTPGVHFKPSIAYSPNGVLGLMWRNWTGTPNSSPYNVWAATSNDEGSTFTSPLEISEPVNTNGSSHVDSPAGDPTWLFFDDDSYITMNNQYAFIAWGDWRHGDRSGFFSSVKLQAFNHG
jgi:hypothetical protein